VATDEELAIAEDTKRVIEQDRAKKLPQISGIPVAVSARHVHLDQETLEKLFGPGARLTARKPLSQPGQFASEEVVTLVGPRRRIEGVRILGPVRKKTQVEISRTDEFFLGVDAPVRGSGDLKGSAPITLEGPKGSVQLAEGLIRALRHVHASPDEATALGVSDGDYVAVAITGGPRDLVFGDVLVRVHPEFSLEMHLDTDEGNAADVASALAQGHDGCMIPLTGQSGKLVAHKPTRRLKLSAEDLLAEHAGPK
ncbi:MAG: phosphate propanoyltransferase, partial [Planctomycetota bacterium]